MNRLRIVLPSWENARQATGLHEAQIFASLRKGIITGLERYETAVVWGDGPIDGIKTTILRMQLRETKKVTGWQSCSVLSGPGTQALADALVDGSNRLFRAVPSWRTSATVTPYEKPQECVWMPFSLSAPDAVMCAVRLERGGHDLGRLLAALLGSESGRARRA